MYSALSEQTKSISSSKRQLITQIIKKEKHMTTAAQAIDLMAVKAVKALEEFRGFTQEQVDKISEAMTVAGVASERYLAEFAVEETGIGNVEDKVIKNHFGTQVVYDYMKGGKSVGVINETDGVISIAEPFGIVAAVTPTTNPTSTTMFTRRTGRKEERQDSTIRCKKPSGTPERL
jgi:acyl-CoA reductase-like NAD-dependent aldehyde dehydrogenase